MTRDTEQTVILLHQVRIGDLIYGAPSETRAWILTSPADEACLQPVEVAVQHGGLSTHTNDLAQVGVRGDHTDRSQATVMDARTMADLGDRLSEWSDTAP
jgi:hypothetical protein